MPETLVSKFGLTLGMSTPRRSEPKTSLIASNGHDATHAPCPMHEDAFTSCALPWMMPIALSGQALTHALEPMQRLGSNTGCRETGSVSSALTFLWNCSAYCARLRARRRKYTPKTISSGIE